MLKSFILKIIIWNGLQVCSTDTDSETVKLEFEKMVQAFVQGASSCTPPLLLSAVVVQVVI